MSLSRQVIDYTCNLFNKLCDIIFEQKKYIAGVFALIIANEILFTDFINLVNPVVSMDPFFIRGSSYNFDAIFSGSLNWGPLYQLWLKLVSFLDYSAVGIRITSYNVCYTKLLRLNDINFFTL